MRSKLRFCALVSAISLCGCAQEKQWMLPPPPNYQHITLEIHPSDAGSDGYIATHGTNGHLYFYQYVGGNKQRGDVELQHGKGDVNIHIALINSPNFAMENIDIKGDLTGDHRQLEPQVEPNGLRAKIHDTNTEALNASYTVQVVDKTDPAHPATIDCHPGIVNH